jgi:hypothetical protein
MCFERNGPLHTISIETYSRVQPDELIPDINKILETVIMCHFTTVKHNGMPTVTLKKTPKTWSSVHVPKVCRQKNLKTVEEI